MKRVYSLLVVPVAAVALGACGSGDNQSGHDMSGHSMGASSAPASEQNAQDVMFAQMMIPHHQQEITMSEQATAKASSPQVKKLASQIEQAQGSEIQKMAGWLRSWGDPTPLARVDMHMPDGMVSDQDMKKLDSLSGKAFDRAFLQMMIEDHQGAISMAKTEQSQGSFADAKSLANNIVASQSAEIATMQKLLGPPAGNCCA
jgi:uncharacterized protein (DUF305 family)